MLRPGAGAAGLRAGRGLRPAPSWELQFGTAAGAAWEERGFNFCETCSSLVYGSDADNNVGPRKFVGAISWGDVVCDFGRGRKRRFVWRGGFIVAVL